MAICLKPARLGGLTAARQIRDLCRKAGMKMRIDGQWCGDVATAAILHLAVGAPPDLLIASCDLREPLEIKPTLLGVISLLRIGCRIAPPPGAGLGIINIEGAIERLGEPIVTFK